MQRARARGRVRARGIDLRPIRARTRIRIGWWFHGTPYCFMERDTFSPARAHARYLIAPDLRSPAFRDLCAVVSVFGQAVGVAAPPIWVAPNDQVAREQGSPRSEHGVAADRAGPLHAQHVAPQRARRAEPAPRPSPAVELQQQAGQARRPAPERGALLHPPRRHRLPRDPAEHLGDAASTSDTPVREHFGRVDDLAIASDRK